MLQLRKKKEPEDTRPQIAVRETDPQWGLTETEVSVRAEAGWGNTGVTPPVRTVGRIVRDNLLTYFNILFTVLALCLIVVRAPIQNLAFMGVVIFNAAIGIVQELRSKKALDAMSILSTPRARVMRCGEERTVSVEELVRDDILLLSSGDQIPADGIVADGECRVNEALVTGEADEIVKKTGDTLLSGSFLISGSCAARLTAVGKDSFVNRLTLAAKEQKKPKRRGMMRSLSDLVKWIGVIIIPLGVALVLKETMVLEREVTAAVTSTVGAIIGMIPEGIYLLASLAMVAGVLRLAGKKTMCRQMDCIETLARVDVLCVDKTGTVTENKMTVEDIVPLCPDRYIADDIRLIMADYVHAMKDDNDTMAALRHYFTGEAKQEPQNALPFSSARKYGGVSFHEDETYLLGAPEVLLGKRAEEYRELIDAYAAKGCRVLLLTLYDGALEDPELAAPQLPLALILLTNKLREEAPATFAYFAEQGVSVRVISGDNPITVSEVARRAGIPSAEKWIDTRTLTTEEEIERAAAECTVFGRVTPDMKRRLVIALKKQGHTVAMTGDGVNDVLALKEADCSVAMASGSEVACQVSQLVLMNSDFSAMPSIVAEGRRVVNNIERSASLYLVKNIFSFCTAILSVLFILPYPITPAQLMLMNWMCIGIPSFFLAMEPNHERIHGRFMRNVLRRALPAGLADIILVGLVMLIYVVTDLPDSAVSTISLGILGVIGLLMVARTSEPLKSWRGIMAVLLAIGFAAGFFGIPQLFGLARLDFYSGLILAVMTILSWPTMFGMEKLVSLIEKILHKAKEAVHRLRAKIKEKL